MKIPLVVFAVVLALSALGCQSIIAPGQTREEMDASGATKWALTEYDYGGSHFVWVPHWEEGLLHLSSPHAANARKLDLLEFKDGVLVFVDQMGDDRPYWAAKLTDHHRIKSPAGNENAEASPLYLAVTLKIVHVGAPLEAVLFAKGFPLYGSEANPHCRRPASEIAKNDVLYYLTTRGGSANEIVLKDGRVEEVRDAKHLSKDWIPFYHPIILP